MNKIKVLNIFLIILILLLSINLILQSSYFKESIYATQTSSMGCSFFNQNQSNEIPINLCCLEIQKQLTCERTSEEKYDLKCYISKNSNKYYLITKDMFNYCKEEGYHVKIK